MTQPEKHAAGLGRVGEEIQGSAVVPSRKNAEYFARVRGRATLDTKIWDDETVDAQGNVIKGAGREAAAAASKARKAKEAKDLAKANATFFGGLGKVQAQVDDGDGHFRSMADKRVRILMCIPWTRFALRP